MSGACWNQKAVVEATHATALAQTQQVHGTLKTAISRDSDQISQRRIRALRAERSDASRADSRKLNPFLDARQSRPLSLCDADPISKNWVLANEDTPTAQNSPERANAFDVPIK
ncbi:MAG: hypothetical protein ACN6O2_11930 [Stenotrophomonas sp.]